ncbi:MAG: N-formylglutamate amidohydrolase [Winogradskyella sp.]|nr:N-formylglutamate amidohydrolase [Winogradskyella sp.]
MIRLSVADILDYIQREEPFYAVAEDYSFTLKIESYTHYVCAAIHDGHQFRHELWDNCLHSEYDRWYEEDPETKSMVKDHQIVLAGCDSRFEYDLNRPPEEAVFETAWGKTLWKKPLTKQQKNKSLKKHEQFYKVAHALVTKLEAKYGCCIVYDMHSYNWKRWNREVPTWNLGTANIDMARFGDVVENFRAQLDTVTLPHHIRNNAKLNDTFYGNGHFLKYLTANTNNTLVLATEISKIYCDELEQIIYPEVVASVSKQLQTIIPKHASLVLKKFSSS